MYQRARYKLDIDDKVIQAGRFDNKSTQEEQEEFLVSQNIKILSEIHAYSLYSDPFWKLTKKKKMKKLEI